MTVTVRKGALLLGLALVSAAGCSSSGDEAADAPTTTEAAATSTTGVTQMSIPDLSTGDPTPAANGSAGNIIMLKLYVGDLDEGEAFYSEVFGASAAMDLGDSVRVLTFPDGPGIIMIEEGDDDADKNGSFLIQVPDLDATVAAAEAHGATAEGTFEGAPGGEQAMSVDLIDPWGNGVEVLQRG